MKKADWRSRHSIVPAVYVILVRDNKILLLKRANTSYRDGDYSLPAGHLDGGEPAIQAATREAEEEIGVKIKPEDLSLVHTQHRVAEAGDHERINLFFQARSWNGTPKNLEPQKCSELGWFSLDNPPANMVPEVFHLLKHLSKKQTYGDFGF